MWNFPRVRLVLLILVFTFSSSILNLVSGQTCIDNDDCYPQCCDFGKGECVDGPCASSHEFEGIGCECNGHERNVCKKLNKGPCIPGRRRPFCCEGQGGGQDDVTPGPGPDPGPDPGEGGPGEGGPGEGGPGEGGPDAPRRSFNSKGFNFAKSKSKSRRRMKGPASKFGKASEADYCDCKKGSYWRLECMRQANGCCDPEKRISEGCCYVKKAHLTCAHSDYDIKEYLYDAR